MTKEDLNSDRINYLIWRYLQESNYQETALKLQKEWNVEDPQRFEFAPHVKHRTLVAVLHRGLLYHESERNYAQHIHVFKARRGVATPLPGFFGPLTPLSPPRAADGDDYENARKRDVDPQESQLQNGSPTKRAKLSNGHENGFEAVAMDVDETTNGNGHAYPSPKEVEQPPTPIKITDGPEQGTQVDKVAELGAETTFLTLSDPENPEYKPLLLHCAWSPRDPAILASAGTDKLARLWTISRGALLETGGHVHHPSPPYQDLVDRNSTTRNPDLNSTTTALSWTSDGAAIALASDCWSDGYGEFDSASARVTIWGADGLLLQEYVGFEQPIICLHWNASNTALLALMPEGNSTLITIFLPSMQRTVAHPLFEHNLHDQPLDAVWTSEQEFVVCGGDILCAFGWSNDTITPTQKFETRKGHQLVNAAYDRHSRLLATSTETGVIDIWDQSGQCHSRSAHQGQIISLLWQPVPNHIDPESSVERLLASSGEDGIITIWSTRSEFKPKCSMPMDSAVVALAFTPDGAFLAGASTQQVLIWRLEDVSVPRARWVRGSEPGWRNQKNDFPYEEEDQHCLAWDANGQKLAYGVNSQLAVIEWRPFANGTGH